MTGFRADLRAALVAALAVVALCAWGAAAREEETGIDRHALVRRHDIRWDEPTSEVPLGNGEFCVSVDGTGLQTLGGNTMAHWAWHSEPLPEGFSADDVPVTGTIERGPIAAPMQDASGHGELDRWMFRNPHPANLGRLRLVRADGLALEPADVDALSRTYELWTGLHTSRFTVDEAPVVVQTCVHPDLDLVAVRVDSPLVRAGGLAVALEFPYPSSSGSGPWAGDWDRPGSHRTQPATTEGEDLACLRRTADGLTYHVSVGWSPVCRFEGSADGREHAFTLVGGADAPLEMVVGFAEEPLPGLPGFDETRSAAAAGWETFWRSGGAIDLSGSADPRWMELERRIVLSQYQMAAHSSGSWPSAETGLLGLDPWASQFHMEMVWWHLAHYSLWDRWSIATDALECYQRFLPVARQLAEQFEYRGAKWGKQVGPEGRTAPWMGSFVLHWQQPHPIFFAELEYRLRPTRETLDRWSEVVFATAEYMADFPTRDQDGVYHLLPVMAACEQPTSYDTVFELAYWRFGLDTAQRWRERLGLPRHRGWEEVRNGLAPLPRSEGLYVLSPERPDTHGGDHPDAIGIFGMLPPMDGVDRATARATLEHMVEDWDCIRWGWDFPWVAMAAARHGLPEFAVEALLLAHEQNRYDERGVNTGGPCPYLPGNGGLLYAAAMMAAGWDGAPEGEAPGFPDDGSWVVRHEGLKRAP